MTEEISSPILEGCTWVSNMPAAEWDARLAEAAGHPLQSALWGDARREVDGIEDHRWALQNTAGETLWMARFEVRRIAGLGRVAWIPKGPTGESSENAGGIYPEFLMRLRRAGFILCIDDVYREGGQSSALGEPLGFRPQTIVIDLKRDEQTLLSALDSRCRYSVRAASRAGVTIEHSNNPVEAAEFFDLCRQVSLKKDFELPGSAKLVSQLCEKSRSSAVKAELFLARYQGALAAGAIMICSGVSLHYFWGATDRKFAKLRAGEALQWAVIQWAKKNGLEIYDLEGIDPVANPGTYKFKRKMGGAEITLPGKRAYALAWRGMLTLKLGKWLGRVPGTLAEHACRVQGISTAHARRLGLLASEVSAFGGIQTYMKRIMEVMSGLEKAGEAKCFCISLNDPMPVDASVETGEGNIRFIGAARSKLRFVWQSYANAQPSMTLLVGHVRLAPVAWLLRGIGRISSFVVILHGVEAWNRRPWLERTSLASADAIIATTKFTAMTCAQANGVDQSKFLVIPLCTTDRPVALSPSFKLKGEFRILAVGRQDRSEHYKGYETLVEAVEKLARDHRGVQLHLVGGGDDHARLKTIVDQRGLGPSVTMWGNLADAELAAAYASCDIFALPSKKEGFGIVFLEAMRHGKPCIGGNHGGTPEVIIDGITGFLVDFGDVAGLYRNLKILYNDTARRHEMGAAGRKLFEDNFTFDSFRTRYVRAIMISA